MKLSKLMALCLAMVMTFSTQTSFAAAKKSTKKAKTVATKVVKKKSVKAQNLTKARYGVKGAALQPTSVSNKTHTYREKGKVHKTIGKEASRQYGQVGMASYYGGMFNGRRTANGEIFNENHYTAAHKTLALGSYALVTNLRNNRKVIVKINDRGPFSHSRIIDLSKAAAREIGMIQSGVGKVRVEAMHVDSQGYISGKAAQSLYQLAKREGLPLKIKRNQGKLAFKADETGTKSNVQAVEKSQKSAKSEAKVKTNKPHLTVMTTEKEAKKLVRQVKQPASLQKVGKQYQVTIQVKNNEQAQKVRRQVTKLAHYQSIQYSEK